MVGWYGGSYDYLTVTDPSTAGFYAADYGYWQSIDGYFEADTNDYDGNYSWDSYDKTVSVDDSTNITNITVNTTTIDDSINTVEQDVQQTVEQSGQSDVEQQIDQAETQAAPAAPVTNPATVPDPVSDAEDAVPVSPDAITASDTQSVGAVDQSVTAGDAQAPAAAPSPDQQPAADQQPPLRGAGAGSGARGPALRAGRLP